MYRSRSIPNSQLKDRNCSSDNSVDPDQLRKRLKALQRTLKAAIAEGATSSATRRFNSVVPCKTIREIYWLPAPDDRLLPGDKLGLLIHRHSMMEAAKKLISAAKRNKHRQEPLERRDRQEPLERRDRQEPLERRDPQEPLGRDCQELLGMDHQEPLGIDRQEPLKRDHQVVQTSSRRQIEDGEFEEELEVPSSSEFNNCKVFGHTDSKEELRQQLWEPSWQEQEHELKLIDQNIFRLEKNILDGQELKHQHRRYEKDLENMLFNDGYQPWDQHWQERMRQRMQDWEQRQQRRWGPIEQDTQLQLQKRKQQRERKLQLRDEQLRRLPQQPPQGRQSRRRSRFQRSSEAPTLISRSQERNKLTLLYSNLMNHISSVKNY